MNSFFTILSSCFLKKKEAKRTSLIHAIIRVIARITNRTCIIIWHPSFLRSCDVMCWHQKMRLVRRRTDSNVTCTNENLSHHFLLTSSTVRRYCNGFAKYSRSATTDSFIIRIEYSISINNRLIIALLPAYASNIMQYDVKAKKTEPNNDVVWE